MNGCEETAGQRMDECEASPGLSEQYEAWQETDYAKIQYAKSIIFWRVFVPLARTVTRLMGIMARIVIWMEERGERA